MSKKTITAVILVLTVYLAVVHTTVAVAYTPPPGYSGKPIKYGGWLIGQVYMEMHHIIRRIPWAKITATSVDGTFTKTTTTSGFGSYKMYLPPGNYTVTLTHAHYTQKYDITIREDQIYRLLNIYIERPDMPEFSDKLAYMK
jgi:hypothetical protein